MLYRASVLAAILAAGARAGEGEVCMDDDTSGMAETQAESSALQVKPKKPSAKMARKDVHTASGAAPSINWKTVTNGELADIAFESDPTGSKSQNAGNSHTTTPPLDES